MIYFIIGLVMFFGLYLYLVVCLCVVELDLCEWLGYGLFMGGYSLVLLIGFGLIIYGFGVSCGVGFFYLFLIWV